MITMEIKYASKNTPDYNEITKLSDFMIKLLKNHGDYPLEFLLNIHKTINMYIYSVNKPLNADNDPDPDKKLEPYYI